MNTERSEEHTSELQSHVNLVCRLLLEKKKKKQPRLQELVGKHQISEQGYVRHLHRLALSLGSSQNFVTRQGGN